MKSRRLPIAEQGQGLAEFAIAFPILMLIVGAIIQFGIIFWGQNTLTQIVRDTGRWAATQQQCADPVPIIATANDIAARSTLIGYTAAWTASDVTVTWSGSPCPPADNSTAAFVTISITHRVPVFFPLIPGSGDISSSTQYRMEPVVSP